MFTGLSERLTGRYPLEDIVNPETGEVLVETDTVITPEVARDIQNYGINVVDVKINDRKVRIIGNGTVDIHDFVELKNLEVKENVNYEVLKNILENNDNDTISEIVLNDDIIKEFGIGLSLDSQNSLLKLLTKKGYKENNLVELGIINNTNDKNIEIEFKVKVNRVEYNDIDEES